MLPDDYSGASADGPQPHGGVLKAFPAGVSGNPLGRPKGSKNRSTIAKELASVMLSAKGINGVESNMSAEHAMMAALFRKAIDGDVSAIKEAQDTLYGKLTDKQELTGTHTQVQRIERVVVDGKDV